MKTILLVEDDEPLRSAVRESLQGRGYHVEVAENGEEALARLQNDPRPGLILLDLMMPGFDGWDFVALRRSDPSLAAIPVVILSAQLLGPERDSVLPVNGFVRKPIDSEKLLAEVERYI